MSLAEKKKRRFRHSSSFYNMIKKAKTQSRQTSTLSSAPESDLGSCPLVPNTVPDIRLTLSTFSELDVPGQNPDFLGGDTMSTDSSVPDLESEAQHRKKSLKKELREWALANRITHAALNPLLKILKDSGHNELPLDARTLLQTPSGRVILEKMGSGEYWYNGISKNIILALEDLENIPSLLSIVINIDGIPPFKSSSIEFWPILFRINEIDGPPMTAAVYCGDSKPPLEEFLKDFVSELKELTERGLTIDIRGEETNLTVTIKYIVCDTPARSFIKGVVGFNSYHGCIKCTTVGQYDRNGRHMSFPNINCSLRTDESFRQKLDEDHHKENSPLLDLQLNMVDQIIVADSLHLLDLGIMRKCLYGWVYGTYNFKKNKLSAQEISMLSEKLMQVNMTKPSEIHRSVRSLRALKNWKGIEYRTVLMYIGPAILKEFLSLEVYHNFLVLHVAVTILSCDYYRPYISVAEQLIKDYIEQYGKLYGLDSIGSNVHNLCHIVGDVKRFGNLSQISSYVFENFLGKIKNLLRSGNQPLAQIAKRIQEFESYCYVTKKSGKAVLKNVFIHKGNQVFKTLLLNNLILNADQKNKWFLTKSNKIVAMIYAVEENNNILIYGAPVQYQHDLYTLPIKSSMINEYKSCKSTVTPEFFNLKEIKCKMFCIKSGENLAFIPINHSLDLFDTAE